MALSRAPRPRFFLLAPLAALLLALGMLLPASAGARVAGPHAHPASAGKTRKHSRRTKHRARKHHTRKHSSHKAKKLAKHASTPYELVPAACEDGTLPSHSGGGSYSCGDGSAPSCEEGTLRSTATGLPVCLVKTAKTEESSGEVEFECEAEPEGETPAGCERPEEGEEEDPEEE